MKAIKWAYVYGSLDVEIFDTLNEAADMAEGASEYGSESLLYIEHDGDLYDINWVDDRADAKRAARPTPPPPPPVTHHVEVKSPDAKWVRYDGYRSEEATHRDVAELLEALGADRVRIVAVGQGPA